MTATTEDTLRQKDHEDAPEYDADGYKVDGYRGIAWSVLGYEVEPDEDTEWTGIYNRTGRLICRMVGDDRHFAFDPDEVHAIKAEDYCPECGQIGCKALAAALGRV